jgi:hypothetical protein
MMTTGLTSFTLSTTSSAGTTCPLSVVECHNLIVNECGLDGSVNSRTASTCSRTLGNDRRIVHTGSGFKMLEKSLYWHARAFEQPRTADSSRNALNSRTLISIEN